MAFRSVRARTLRHIYEACFWPTQLQCDRPILALTAGLSADDLKRPETTADACGLI